MGSLKESGAVYAVSGDMFGNYEVSAQVGTVDDLELLAPVDPGNVIAVGANYLAHILEGHDEDAIPKFPMLFMKPNSAITGPGAPIVLPDPAKFTQSMNDPDLQQDPFGEVHYEAELVAVIGKSCRNVSEDEALDYVLGYSCGNDVSARGLQVKEMATGVLLMSKGMDTFAPLGPCIATDRRPIQPRDHGPAQRRSEAAQQHQRPAVQRGGPCCLHLAGCDPQSRRLHLHGYVRRAVSTLARRCD